MNPNTIDTDIMVLLTVGSAALLFILYTYTLLISHKLIEIEAILIFLSIAIAVPVLFLLYRKLLYGKI